MDVKKGDGKDRSNLYLQKRRTYANEHRFIGVDFVEVKPSSSIREDQTIHLHGIVGVEEVGPREGGWDPEKGNFDLSTRMEKTSDGKTIIKKDDVVVATLVISKEAAKMLLESLDHILIKGD